MLDSVISGLANLPSLLVDLGALVVAIARWSRHPVVSLLVTVGLGLHLAVRATYWLSPIILRSATGESSLRLFFAGGALVSAVGSGLILAAVFTERPATSTTEPPAPRW